MSGSLAAGQADIGSALTDMWRSVLLFLPKLVGFIVILVIGWIVARFVAGLVGKVLEKIGFDRAVERGGIGRALQRSRYDASDILAKLVYYAILLLALQLAFGLWGPNPVSALIHGIVSWLPRAAVAIIIIVVAAAIAAAVKDIVSGLLGGLSYGRVLANLASWFILALGVIAALNQVGIATAVTTPVLIAVLATVAGILIVGVGGGAVRPMQDRWERWLSRAEAESPNLREHMQARAAGMRDRRAAEQAAAAEQMEPRVATAPPVDTSATTRRQPAVTVPGNAPAGGTAPAYPAQPAGPDDPTAQYPRPDLPPESGNPQGR